MLVLSRKNDQAVVIGGSGCLENILKVTVLKISGGSVKLGFEADEDVVIHREEVWEGAWARVPPRPVMGDAIAEGTIVRAGQSGALSGAGSKASTAAKLVRSLPSE